MSLQIIFTEVDRRTRKKIARKFTVVVYIAAMPIPFYAYQHVFPVVRMDVGDTSAVFISLSFVISTT